MMPDEDRERLRRTFNGVAGATTVSARIIRAWPAAWNSARPGLIGRDLIRRDRRKRERGKRGQVPAG